MIQKRVIHVDYLEIVKICVRNGEKNALQDGKRNMFTFSGESSARVHATIIVAEFRPEMPHHWNILRNFIDYVFPPFPPISYQSNLLAQSDCLQSFP